jgi:hypothetical protein
MSLDEQLNQAFDTLAERLRGEIGREVDRRVTEQVGRQVDEEVDRRMAEIAAATAAAVAEPVPEPVVDDQEPAEPAEPAFDTASAARQAEAVRAIDAARSLTDVLDALLASARAEASSADIWLSRAGQLHQWRGPQPGNDARETPSGSLVVPISLAGSDVGFLYADFQLDEAANIEQRRTNVQLFTRYASRWLEALTAFKVARALTQPRIADSGMRVADSSAADSSAASEDETSARRYARLLVSEIKLYHEPAVLDGRRDRDLATRLGGEIARARVMYEQRVPPEVRERADYFRDELVRTLCNGDSSLLEVRS